MFTRRGSWNRLCRLMLVGIVAMLLLFAALPILAAEMQEGEEAFVPIISFLPEEPVILGVAGGLIVTVLISVLKYARIVGKDGFIPSDVANYALSVLVAALAMILEGQSIWAAFVTALSSIITATGVHREVGHRLFDAAGTVAEKVLGKS